MNQKSSANISLTFVIVSIVLVSAIVLMAAGYLILWEPTSLIITPTIKKSVVVESKQVKIGEDFLITLPANPSTGYSWEADFDENYLTLRSKDFILDSGSDWVDKGGTEVFTFAPIKAGETTITMSYGRPWESKPSEIKVFKYDIKKKQPAGQEMKFETVLRGYYNEYYNKDSEGKNFAITSKSEWEPISERVGLELSAPIALIDFNKDMLIAVFQGSRSTGGYSTEITRILENESNLEVHIKEVSPGPNCFVTEALTGPYHIVKIKKSDKEVIFKVENDVIDCK